MEVAHPYVPKDLYLPDFTPNIYPATTITTCVVGAAILVSAIIWILSGMFPRTTKLEKLIMSWMAFNGLLHLSLELYLAFKPDFYTDKTGNIFAEIWKEYSKGDSRYLRLDSTLIAIEIISILVSGPTHLLAVYAVLTHKSYRYVLQVIASLVELYGLAMFILTAIIEGNAYHSSTYYYYAYFVGSNFPWALIPFLIIIRSWRKICESESPINKAKVQ